MKTAFLCILLCLFARLHAQVTDDFSDNDFTANPTWSGTSSDFVIAPSGELQINNFVAASSYLTTNNGLTSLNNTEWHFRIRQTFSPSSSNYGRVYLTSSSAILTTNPDGYFLQFGEAGATDAVRLYKSISGLHTLICSSPDGQIANSFSVGVKVIRDQLGNWNLFVDPTGGTTYGSAFTGFDSGSSFGAFFGVLGVYTASNASKFYFDNFYIGPEIIDTNPPVLLATSVINAQQIDVLFDENIHSLVATNVTNFSINPQIAVQTVQLDNANQALLHLTVAPLTNGQTYQLSLDSIRDLAGNNAPTMTTSFTYLVGDSAVKGDIIISEFLADPDPSVGLPLVEYIELYNKSNKYIDLTGWKIGDAFGDGTLTGGFIYPGAYKIICSNASLVDYPNGIGVTSFPSLNNAGDAIVLKQPNLFVMDQINYTTSWYKDDNKKNGGFSLELINPNDPCSDEDNWRASNAQIGGTPGTQNSVFSILPDITAPNILSALATAPNYITVVYSEGMDSLSLLTNQLTASPNLTLASTVVTNATTAIFSFNETFSPSLIYTITLASVADCWLNDTMLTFSVAQAEPIAVGDIVINELLFDPIVGGSDFVELVNTSNKVLNLNGLSVSNIENDSVANTKAITADYLLFPNEYLVITTDSLAVFTQFPATIPGRFFVNALPPMNNDSGTVILHAQQQLIDRVSYLADWHFSLLDDTENKSLEKINPKSDGMDHFSWHTAAESIGFATPGGKNSQYSSVTNAGDFGINEVLFSPDNDGFQDIASFYYTLNEPGYVATATIYNDEGTIIKTLFANELLGAEGSFYWDGSTNNQQKAAIGIYFCVLDAFQLDGSRNYVKRIAFTLAGKIN